MAFQPTPNGATMTDDEEFEKATYGKLPSDDYEIDMGGEYHDEFVWSAYAGWKAALTLERARAEELVKALEDIAPDLRFPVTDECPELKLALAQKIAREALAKYRSRM
jgi:hypothetical protein